jgi:phage replication-related protein YjqB (UPF0714/DUF867 family)
MFAAAFGAHAADKYADFAGLAKAERDGVDYRITALDRKAPVAVFAIHAGAIEPGSGELARAIAGETLSLYLFESLKPLDDASLHVTSTHFDEPRALALAGSSAVCVSVHGIKGTHEGICIGGANAALRRAVFEGLEAASLGGTLEEPCGNTRVAGVAPTNIVNRCRDQGVQLELTRGLRDRLRADPALAAKMGSAVREAAGRYSKSTSKEKP